MLSSPPQGLSQEARRDFLHMVLDCGLVISTICGDLGRVFGDAAVNPGLIEQSFRLLDLSMDWECGIVTAHIGAVPDHPAYPRYAVMQGACCKLAEYADSMGAVSLWKQALRPRRY